MKSKKNLFKKNKKIPQSFIFNKFNIKKKIIKKNPDLDMLGWVG